MGFFTVCFFKPLSTGQAGFVTQLRRTLLACLLLTSVFAAPGKASPNPPNVLLILADDLGYGDLGVYNSDSKIQTPRLDQLAGQGLRFTDAHTPSAVCSPTRYGLLTGRYSWRTWLKESVLDGFDPPLIAEGRLTIASLLRREGYSTACIGKWHLGMNWHDKSGNPIPVRKREDGHRSGSDVQFNETITGGPMDRGFDHFFGISASLDMSPYAFIEGRRFTKPPGLESPEKKDLFYNQVSGVIASDFKLDEVLPRLTREAVRYLDETAAASARPFFLYLPLTSPHLPVVPSQGWAGKSKAGLYADFVQQTDDCVGQVLDALDRNGLASDTLVIFTSDNGGLWHDWDPKEVDDVRAYKPKPRGTYNRSRGHQSNGSLRGTKADIYEGGHRVPFLVRWPGKISAGETSSALVELTDVFATLAELLDLSLPSDAAEDSISFARVLKGETESSRTFSVHHSLAGVFALREGPWKFVPSRGSGGFSTPKVVKPQPGEAKGQLYHLLKDAAETGNLYLQHSDIVKRMQGHLEEIKSGTSTRE